MDVSIECTSVCIVDGDGRVVREAKVASDPAALVAALTAVKLGFERIGLEAGPLLQWLYTGLAEAGLPVICIDARHLRAALTAQPNKSDRNDARGIAQMIWVGLYKAVHVKTQQSQERRMLLTGRKLLLEKLRDVDNDLRGIPQRTK
ncbi:MAG: transposase [Alphaproteobacteria bacterium]|nr:transposase [Alphaproteobacteria bacterium]